MDLNQARGQLQLAREAGMVEDQLQVVRLSRDKARQLARHGLPASTQEPDVPQEEPDLGIHIGDIITYGSQPNGKPPAASQAPQPQTAPATTDASAVTPAGGMGTLGKIAAGAALAAGGLGAGSGLTAYLNSLNKPVPAVVQPADQTLYDLKLLHPDQPK